MLKFNNHAETIQRIWDVVKKTDRLHPVTSLCVYYGEDEWDGPLSLIGMLCIPEHLTPLVSDYKMNLIQIRNSDSLIFHNNEVHTVFDLSRLIYNKEFDKIQSTYMNQKFDTELSLVIGTITNTKSFINHALQSDSEGGSINMCRAFEEWQEECIQKGEIIGTLKTYKKFSVLKEETLKNIITDFSLSEEDARNYMEKYW